MIEAIQLIFMLWIGYNSLDKPENIVNKEKVVKTSNVEVKSEPIITDIKECDLEIIEIWVDQIGKDGKPLRTCRGKLIEPTQKSRIVKKYGKGK